MVQVLKYRLRYAWRRICHFLGFCPSCGERVNFTPRGVAICPNCKKR